MSVGTQTARAIINDVRYHLLVGKAWNEAEHPRDNAGMWTDKDGGGSGGGGSSGGDSIADKEQAVEKMTAKMRELNSTLSSLKSERSTLLKEQSKLSEEHEAKVGWVKAISNPSDAMIEMEKKLKKTNNEMDATKKKLKEMDEKRDEAETSLKEAKAQAKKEQKTEKGKIPTGKWTKDEQGDWVIQPDGPAKVGDKVMVRKSDGTEEEHTLGQDRGTVWGKNVFAVSTKEEGKSTQSTNDSRPDAMTWSEYQDMMSDMDYDYLSDAQMWESYRTHMRQYYTSRGREVPPKWR